MPISHSFQSGTHIRIGLWKLTESEAELAQLAQITSEELHTVSQFKSSRRRKQWLGSRALIYAMTGKKFQISYQKTGKPYLNAANFNIALSHSRSFVALVIHEKAATGIDIQYCSPKLKRISQRFLNESEKAAWMESGYSDFFLHTVWGAKEALYKIHGVSRVIFKEHLWVKFLEKEGEHQCLNCSIKSDEYDEVHQMIVQKIEDFVLVYPCD